MYLFLAKNEPLKFSQLLLPTQTLLIKYDTSLKQPSTIDADCGFLLLASDRHGGVGETSENIENL